LEDLLEELVGEIHDEFDTDADPIQVMANGDLRITATYNVSDLNAAINTDLPEGDWDSVGGLVFSTLGRVPEAGDTVDIDSVELVVEAVDGRRISSVRIKGAAALLESKEGRGAIDPAGAPEMGDADKDGQGRDKSGRNGRVQGNRRTDRRYGADRNTDGR
jgi:putative hemolysin